MKNILIVFLFAGLAISCTKGEVQVLEPVKSGYGCAYNGKSLHRGPEGGCYYKNSNGNKTYVDRSYCNCK